MKFAQSESMFYPNPQAMNFNLIVLNYSTLLKILPQFALHEDFQAVREKYIAAFHQFLLAAAGDDVSVVLYYYIYLLK